MSNKITKIAIASLTGLLATVAVAAKTNLQWTDASPLPVERQEIYADVRDDRIYTLGGLFAGAQNVGDDFLEYDASRDVWTELSPLPETRHHVVVSIIEDKLYGIGGFAGGFPGWEAQSDVFVYDFNTEEWTESTPLPEPRGEHTAAVIDGKIYVAGGRFKGTPESADFNSHFDTASMVVFDPIAEEWLSAPDMPTARNSHAAAVINGKMYVVGGRQFTEQENGEYANVNVASLEVYDPAAESWETLAPLPQAAGGITAAVLDGKLYAFGGEQWVPEKTVIAESWVYDPASDQWTAAPDMPTPRHGIAAGVIGNRIYVLGGATETGAGAVSTNETLVVR
ncbi:kelch repeat-containing protein [cf. Phormidesmis sp. LEGE 11477]|uniref:Kelch repeat-containing protein n=1 Tax=cf. Phormidesmis sp. LEGE 11477 TaxID=1828680 RepID=UPI00187F1622|nr:kelch repeat-containing protein [cf. Phormidesmis sp. LEGE 11477]MBE9059512.1 kelch-like protein [cf. Phormidesmis sp. LEGE 11477]